MRDFVYRGVKKTQLDTAEFRSKWWVWVCARIFTVCLQYDCLLHFAWGIAEAKCILVTAVLSVCPSVPRRVPALLHSAGMRRGTDRFSECEVFHIQKNPWILRDFSVCGKLVEFCATSVIIVSWGNGKGGCPVVVMGGFAISSRVSLLWQHGAKCWQVLVLSQWLVINGEPMWLCSCCTAASAAKRSTRSVWSLTSCQRLTNKTAGVVSCANTAASVTDRTTYVLTFSPWCYWGRCKEFEYRHTQEFCRCSVSWFDTVGWVTGRTFGWYKMSSYCGWPGGVMVSAVSLRLERSRVQHPAVSLSDNYLGQVVHTHVPLSAV